MIMEAIIREKRQRIHLLRTLSKRSHDPEQRARTRYKVTEEVSEIREIRQSVTEMDDFHRSLGL